VPGVSEGGGRALGAWLHTRAVQAGGRLVIAIDGKTVRGAKGKDGKAPAPGRGRSHTQEDDSIQGSSQRDKYKWRFVTARLSFGIQVRKSLS